MPAKQSSGEPSLSSTSIPKPRLRHCQDKCILVVTPFPCLPPASSASQVGQRLINPTGHPHQRDRLSSPYIPPLALQKTLSRPDAAGATARHPPVLPRPLCISMHEVSSPTGWTSQSPTTPGLQKWKRTTGWCGILIHLNRSLNPWYCYLARICVQRKCIRGSQVQDAEQMLPCPSLWGTRDGGTSHLQPVQPPTPLQESQNWNPEHYQRPPGVKLLENPAVWPETMSESASPPWRKELRSYHINSSHQLAPKDPSMPSCSPLTSKIM